MSTWSSTSRRSVPAKRSAKPARLARQEARPPDAPGNLPRGGDELLSKKRVLRNQLCAAANQIHRQPENELKKVDHVSSLTSSTGGWICSQDGSSTCARERRCCRSSSSSA